MDAVSYLKFILALVVVLGMILAVTWVLKRLGVGQQQLGALGRKRRLRTVEAASIDGRHRLVLIRRDAVEHLVLLGPASSQVIETGIPAAADEPPGETAPAFSFKSLLAAARPAAAPSVPPKDPAP
jgi:flagellar protein FliO/FliZ